MRHFILASLLLSLIELCLSEGSIGSEYFQRPVTRIHTTGISPLDESKLAVIQSLLGDPRSVFQSQSAQLYESVTNSKAAAAAEEEASPLYLVTLGEPVDDSLPDAGVSVLYLDGSVLMDDTLVINRICDSLAALKLGPSSSSSSLSEEEEKEGAAQLQEETTVEGEEAVAEDRVPTIVENKAKKALLILYSGPVSGAQRVEALLNDAWQLHGFEVYGDFPNVNLLKEMDARILMVPPKLKKGITTSMESRSVVKESLDKNEELRGVLDDALVTHLTTATSNSQSSLSSSSAAAAAAIPEQTLEKSRGITDCIFIADEAFEWALKAAQASVERLNKYMANPLEFSGYMANLIKSAQEIFDEKVAVLSPAPSAAAAKLVKTELTARIYSKMLPFYKRQVQLARNEIAKTFNAQIAEIEVSIDIMRDFNGVKNTAIVGFDQACKLLTPKNAPLEYSAGFEIREFGVTLGEFIDSKEDFYKLLGVLSRGRKPIDISFHTLFNHPLGRDYRAEPLGMESLRDEPIYQNSPPVLQTVPAATCRSVLQRHVEDLENKRKSPSQSPFSLSQSKTKNEFAREMAMFPLSVKNPDVLFQAGGRKRRGRKSTPEGPPKKDPEREAMGPERFIRYDVGPMPEVKKQMDRAAATAAQDFEEDKTLLSPLLRVSKTLNRVPIAGNAYYTLPPVNYLNKASASAKK